MAISVFTASMASAGTFTSAVDLGTQGWKRIFVDVPTLSTAAELYVTGAPTATDTFKRVYHEHAQNHAVIPAPIPSGTATTAVVDVGFGSYETLFLHIKTSPSAVSLSIFGAEALAGTYVHIANTFPVVAGTDADTSVIPASFISNGHAIQFKSGFRFYKFISDAAYTDGLDMRVLGTNGQGIRQMAIPSGVGTNGGTVEINNGLRHIKIEASAAVANGATFNFICSD